MYVFLWLMIYVCHFTISLGESHQGPKLVAEEWYLLPRSHSTFAELTINFATRLVVVCLERQDKSNLIFSLLAHQMSTLDFTA